MAFEFRCAKSNNVVLPLNDLTPESLGRPVVLLDVPAKDESELSASVQLHLTHSVRRTVLAFGKKLFIMNCWWASERAECNCCRGE